MTNVVHAALSNIGGALCSTPQSLADARYTRVPCSNAAKTRIPLKFAGVTQIPEPISAASGPKFTILSGHVEQVFFRLSIRTLVAKTYSSTKFVGWCRDGDILRPVFSARLRPAS